MKTRCAHPIEWRIFDVAFQKCGKCGRERRSSFGLWSRWKFPK